MKLPGSALGALEIVLNRYLEQDAQARAACAALDGQRLRLQLRELDLAFDLCPEAQGLRVVEASAEPPTAAVRGSLSALTRAWLEAGESMAAARELEITGDAEFAQTLFKLLREAEFDFEEWLAGPLGDVAAHRLGQFLRGTFGYARQVAQTLTLDTAEYLREETRDLVHPAEVEQWSREVNQLRETADRLEARARRLLAK